MQNIRLIIQKAFEVLESEDYCLIKKHPNFPNLVVGSDLDIFGRNTDQMISLLSGCLREYLDDNSRIDVLRSSYGAKVDLVSSDKILLRFDLYKLLPTYKKVNIKPSFFDVVIESAKFIEIEGYKLKVPDRYDDHILRYIEFQEFYSERPSKIGHLDYIINSFEGKNIDPKKFFDRLHYFTSLPPIVESSKKESAVERIKSLLSKTSKSLSENGLRSTTKSIFRYLKRWLS